MPTPKEIEIQLLKILESAADLLTGAEETERMKIRTRLIAEALVHRNQDNSVDAELRIREIPNNLDVPILLTAVERSLEQLDSTWVQVGIRYPPRSDEPIYTRFLGMSQAESYFHRKLTDAIDTGKKINVNLTEKKRQKPEQVFIRFHWNYLGIKPEERWPGAGPSDHSIGSRKAPKKGDK